MKNELQQKIYKDFPKLFPRNSRPMFGFEVSDGWYDLIYNLCKEIDIERKKNKIIIDVTQVKEKFGGLRFYCTGNTAIFNLVRKAEDLSFKTCEVCGRKGKHRDIGRWLQTLCFKHYILKLSKRKYEYFTFNIRCMVRKWLKK